MPRRLVLTLIGLGLAMAVTAAPVSAGGLGTLDQAQESGPDVEFVNLDTAWAQVFTAGLTGQLDQIDLLLADAGGGPGTDLTVEIWTVTSGAPASPVPGATATVLHADVPDGPQTATWVSIPFNVPSMAGTQYAIAVSSPGSGECETSCWFWFADDTGPYAGGLSYVSIDGGATFPTAQARDQAFRTFVALPPTPVASNLPNAAMGNPADTSPLLLVGLAVLLIGSLGMLAFAGMVVLVARRLGAFRAADPSRAVAPGATTEGSPPAQVPPA
jgi:hypothetical protein